MQSLSPYHLLQTQIQVTSILSLGNRLTALTRARSPNVTRERVRPPFARGRRAQSESRKVYGFPSNIIKNGIRIPSTNLLNMMGIEIIREQVSGTSQSKTVSVKTLRI